MANYYGKGRSDSFKVKDIDKLKRLCRIYELQIHGPDENDKVLLLSEREDGEPQNTIYTDEDTDFDELIKFGIATKEDREFDDEVDLPDFSTQIAQLLDDGEVFVWRSVGNEAMRYLSGHSYAVNQDGEVISLNLDHIYDIIKVQWLTKEAK
jgi:hypothetical protein